MTGEVFIILFRGVGGKTQLPVKPLREKLTEAGFGNVRTYINSGNVVLASTLPRAAVVELVARVCVQAFGFDKAVYALTRAEWDRLVRDNPFPEAAATPTKLHAAVLETIPLPEKVEMLRALAVEGERIAIVGKVAYLHTPHGFGGSRFAERFDKGIAVPNTARNWNTVLKLAEMAAAADGAGS